MNFDICSVKNWKSFKTVKASDKSSLSPDEKLVSLIVSSSRGIYAYAYMGSIAHLYFCLRVVVVEEEVQSTKIRQIVLYLS